MSVVANGTGRLSGISTLNGLYKEVNNIIDVSDGTYFKCNVASNIQFTLVNVPAAGKTVEFHLEIVNGGTYEVDFWSNIEWVEGISAQLTTGPDLIKFTSVDGGASWTGEVIGYLLGESNLNHWIATLGGNNTDYGQGIAVDSSGNVYVNGQTLSQGAGSGDFLIAKYNTSGTLQWQRTLGGASNEDGWDIAVDSSGNVYVTGETASQGAGNRDAFIAKYNTSGTLQWQRTLGGAGDDYGWDIAVDSSGNVYVTGTTQSQGAGDRDAFIAKYNTSGTLQWQRTLGGASSDYGYGIAVDSSGNVYVTGRTISQGAGSSDVLIAKYNTSGTIQWQRVLGGASADFGYDIAVDSSGNVYVTGRTLSQGAGNYDVLIAKYNTSGTLQWQRTLGGAEYDEGVGIAVDSSGNVYVAGFTESQGAGSDDVLIAKYNTSGTIQWQRVLGGADVDIGYGISVDSSGNVYIAGYTESQGAGNYDVLIAKLPGDGSKTGTYGNLTYQPSTLTDAASTLTSATSTLTSATSTLTSSTATLTDNASSLLSSTQVF